MNFYLYGLQRSGTNVIQRFLEENFDISFMNREDRQSPYHKHFRLYDNKNIIPKTDVKNQYKNSHVIGSLEELDKLLGDMDKKNRYIVVYKNIFSWLPSIEKWAKKCKWKTNSKMEFVEDYLNFIQKWYSIKNERVFFINHEDYLNLSVDNSPVDKLAIFLGKNPKKIKYSFDKVNHSEKFTASRKKYYINHEYMNLFSEEEVDKIKQNLVYKEIVDYIL